LHADWRWNSHEDWRWSRHWDLRGGLRGLRGLHGGWRGRLHAGWRGNRPGWEQGRAANLRTVHHKGAFNGVPECGNVQGYGEDLVYARHLLHHTVTIRRRDQHEPQSARIVLPHLFQQFSPGVCPSQIQRQDQDVEMLLF
jgi:hypothetical protein